MSEPLSMRKVLDKLQEALHDLHDMSAFGGQEPFRGVVIEGMGFTHREHPRTQWTITIEPYVPTGTPPSVRPIQRTRAEQVDADYFQEHKDDDEEWGDPEPPLRTKTGKILTDEDIQALADEAERGYTIEDLQRMQIKPRRRPDNTTESDDDEVDRG